MTKFENFGSQRYILIPSTRTLYRYTTLTKITEQQFTVFLLKLPSETLRKEHSTIRCVRFYLIDYTGINHYLNPMFCNNDVNIQSVVFLRLRYREVRSSSKLPIKPTGIPKEPTTCWNRLPFSKETLWHLKKVFNLISFCYFLTPISYLVTSLPGNVSFLLERRIAETLYSLIFGYINS